MAVIVSLVIIIVGLILNVVHCAPADGGNASCVESPRIGINHQHTGLTCFNYLPRFVANVSRYIFVTVIGCDGLDRLPEDSLSPLGEHLLVFLVDCHFSKLQIEPKAFEGLPNLLYVIVTKAGLTSFHPGSWAMGSDTQLVLDYNSIASFDDLQLSPAASHCLNNTDSDRVSGLTSLKLAYNNIRELRRYDLCQLPLLNTLDLRGNKLSAVHPEAFHHVALLNRLDLSDNKLSTLPVGLFNRSVLEEVDLSGNRLTGRDVLAAIGGGAQHLRSLNVTDNRIDDLAGLELLTNLQQLNLNGNNISEFPESVCSSLINLEQLRLDGNAIVQLNLSCLNELLHLSLAHNGLETVVLPSSIVYLQLQHNRLKNLPDVSHMDKLVSLNVAYNHIIRIDAYVFTENQKLLSLNLTGNKIEFIDHRWVASLKHGQTPITDLSLRDNRLTSVNGLFANTNRLLNLDLSYNYLTNFTYLDLGVAVASINLSHNMLTEIGDDVVGQLDQIGDIAKIAEYTEKQVKTIDVSFNNLSSIVYYSFPFSLVFLLANDNQIATVQPGSFTNFKKLKTLNLRNNRIESPCHSWFTLAGQRLFRQAATVRLELDGNPLRCNCATEWLSWFLNTYTTPITDSLMRPTDVESSLTCTKDYMARWDDQPVVTIAEATAKRHFLCSTDSTNECGVISQKNFCPNSCNCHSDVNGHRVIVDCSNANLTSVPVADISPLVTSLLMDGNPLISINNLTFGSFHSLEYLALNSTGLRDLPPGGAFRNLSKLVQLYLDDNKLTTLDDDDFLDLNRLKILGLGGNRLENISNAAFSMLKSLTRLDLSNNDLSQFEMWSLNDLLSGTLKNLSLDGNSWNCSDCDYFRRLRDTLQKYSERLSNASELLCSDLNAKVLTLDPSYCRNDTVLLDQILLQSPVVAALSSVLSILAVVALLSTLTYKFRLEIQVLVYARYGVRLSSGRWWHRRQPAGLRPVVGINKLHDVFISYSSLDEQLLVEKILPGLETVPPVPYNVCLHHRNFRPGAFITEAILEAVAVSSVTLLLLSKNFVQSEWCKFEFKIAHLQMLRDPQCRLVVVVLEPQLPTIADSELQLFLSTNTYLCWGDKLFWKKLYFVLPEPKPPQPFPTYMEQIL